MSENIYLHSLHIGRIKLVAQFSVTLVNRQNYQKTKKSCMDRFLLICLHVFDGAQIDPTIFSPYEITKLRKVLTEPKAAPHSVFVSTSQGTIAIRATPSRYYSHFSIWWGGVTSNNQINCWWNRIGFYLTENRKLLKETTF